MKGAQHASTGGSNISWQGSESARGTQRLSSDKPSPPSDRRCARWAARAVHSFNRGLLTRTQSGAVSSLRCWSCRSSASTVLELLQPVAGCCANETVLAMGQPVRIHIWTCSRCAAAALLRYHSNLQVSRASSHALPAMHGSHCNDRASCARTAGSCSASSSTIRLAVCDRPHVGGALGERAELGLLSLPVES